MGDSIKVLYLDRYITVIVNGASVYFSKDSEVEVGKIINIGKQYPDAEVVEMYE